MKYLCLVYHDEEKLEALPESEYNAIVDEVLDYRAVLRQSEHSIVSALLHPAATVTTVRVRHGKVSITDGPFAETKEQLGGFYVIDARDLNDAIRVASKTPPACTGCIEVRPIEELDFRLPRWERWQRCDVSGRSASRRTTLDEFQADNQRRTT